MNTSLFSKLDSKLQISYGIEWNKVECHFSVNGMEKWEELYASTELLLIQHPLKSIVTEVHSVKTVTWCGRTRLWISWRLYNQWGRGVLNTPIERCRGRRAGVGAVQNEPHFIRKSNRLLQSAILELLNLAKFYKVGYRNENCSWSVVGMMNEVIQHTPFQMGLRQIWCFSLYCRIRTLF